MKSTLAEQVREILSSVTGEDELSAIEKVVAEARGRIPPQMARGFWTAKRPCWEMCQCPEIIRNECPAPNNQAHPCWEIEGTYCKLDDYGATGTDTTICQTCRVYKRWGESKPIALTLTGRGIDTSLKAITNLRIGDM